MIENTEVLDDISAIVESKCRPTLFDLFKNAAKKNMNKPAVCFKTEFNSRAISYQDLLIQCQRISLTLEDLGVKYGYVGVHLEQSLPMPVVILGILQHGLAFVCLSFDQEPWELHIVKHLNIRWIFTDSNLQNKNWTSRKGIEVFGNFLSLCENVSGENVTDNHKKDDWIMAYAIETSGTTGQPKIVKVPHQCIVPNIQHLKCLLSIVPDDLIFLAAPLTFDPSIIEIFLALTSGALMLIVAHHVRKSPSLFLKMLNNVTIIEATPSFLKCWSKEEISKSLLHEESSLRVLLLGGEPCPTKNILKQWKMDGNKTQLFNVYGITEVSCWASIHKISLTEAVKGIDVNEEMKIPLGDALSQTTLKVKDRLGKEILNGEGELFIGSKERVCFIDNETMQDLEFPVFRATGDIVQIDGTNGKIFYLGRKNNVIKRFGHRVSLDKINEIVNSHNSVAQSCCVWNENTEKLGLFIKLESIVKDNKGFKEKLRRYLLEQLHISHIPDIIINLRSLPLTSHGKLDRNKLKNFISETEHNSERYCMPEHVISHFTSLWSQYLCLESSPSPDNNFVQSGGSSIVAVQLVSDLNEMLGSACTGLIGMLLGHSTFKECCDYLLSTQNKNFNHSETTSNITQMVVEPQVFNLKRKPRDQITEHTHSDKRISTGHGNCSNERKLLFSICRGRIEIGDARKLTVCEMKDAIDISLKWTYDLGKCVDASPRLLLYENGKQMVCIGSHSSVFVAINSINAEPIVDCYLKDRIESSMCSSPCGEIGVVGCYDGYIYGINLDLGVISWKFKTGQMVKSSPALCLNGSAVVVGSYDHHLYCINILKGHLIWSSKAGDGSIYASPCVSAINKSVYVASLDGMCAAFDEHNGTLIWKCKLNSPVFSSPGIMPEEDIVIFAEVLGLVYFFSAVSGEKLWNFQAGGNIFSSFSIQAPSASESNMILFGCHDQHIYCLLHCINSVTLKWKCKLDSAVFATPCVFPVKQGEENISYEVVGASTNGMVYIIDSKCGEKVYSFELPGEVFSSPLVHENEIYVGCRNNKVYCLFISGLRSQSCGIGSKVGTA